MNTGFFHHQIITGPIRSRRLGLSLGVNLLPVSHKICNYDCLYCECGWNTVNTAETDALPTVKDIAEALSVKLQILKEENVKPESVTFSGNGEPTLHPDFKAVVSEVRRIVETVYPDAPPALTVLSNATRIGRDDVRVALGLCTRIVLKLDAGTPDTYARINRLQTGFRLGAYEERLRPETFYGSLLAQLRAFPYPFIVQTLLFRGEYEGRMLDNTDGAEWEAYKRRLASIRPYGIMLYGLDRETPARKLQKLSKPELEARAEALRMAGFKNVQAYF